VLAELILTLPLAKVCQRAFEKHGVSPADLFGRLTPNQFLAVLTTAPGRQDGGGFDRVEALTKANDERGKRGERPVIPQWI